jgi:hypothetical protein
MKKIVLLLLIIFTNNAFSQSYGDSCEGKSDLVIKTTENKSTDKPSTAVETIESIKENAMGFVKSMELLTNFDNADGKRMVFIFYKEMK